MAEIQKQLEYIRDRYGSIEAYVAKTYGLGVPFSLVGDFCLVHLDHPSEEVIQRRIVEFDLNDHFPDDCPICEMDKEMGGFIVFDDGAEDFAEEDETERWKNDLEETLDFSEAPEESIWRCGYLNMEHLKDAPPDTKVNMLLMYLWSNIVELKEDLKSNDAADRVSRLSSEFRAFIKNVQLLLIMPDKIIPWTDMKPSFDRVKGVATDIIESAVEEKMESFCQTLDLFADSVQELLIQRSLGRN